MVRAVLFSSLASHVAAPRAGAAWRVWMRGLNALAAVQRFCSWRQLPVDALSSAQKFEHLLGGFADADGSPQEDSSTTSCSTQGRPRLGESRLCFRVRHWPGRIKTIPTLTLAYEVMVTKREFSKMLKATLFSLEKLQVILWLDSKGRNKTQHCHLQGDDLFLCEGSSQSKLQWALLKAGPGKGGEHLGHLLSELLWAGRRSIWRSPAAKG